MISYTSVSKSLWIAGTTFLLWATPTLATANTLPENALLKNTPIITDTQSLDNTIELGGAVHNLSDNYDNWRDFYIRGKHTLDDKNVIQWETASQNHFDEQGVLGAISYTHNLSPDWYASAGVSSGTADFMPKFRADAAVYRKWLPKRQLITGVRTMYAKSGDGIHKDQALGLTGIYYFDKLPLVAEVGVTANRSNPGSVTTYRWNTALNYGRYQDYYVTLRHDHGREGYLPQHIQNANAVNFTSHTTGVSYRKWVTPRWGYVADAEYYKNPYYSRKGMNVGVFVNF